MYTPTTEELRTRLAELTERAEAARNKYANRVPGPAFDRWLAEEIRKAKADAWQEGYNDGRRQDAEGDDGPRFTNPYREED